MKEKRTCKKCIHYKDVGLEEWGLCNYPLPSYITSILEYIPDRRVWIKDDSANNAIDCKAYQRRYEKHELIFI